VRKKTVTIVAKLKVTIVAREIFKNKIKATTFLSKI
jgi:hypothetical protein